MSAYLFGETWCFCVLRAKQQTYETAFQQKFFNLFLINGLGQVKCGFEAKLAIAVEPVG